jgi:hypothetical protein
MKSHLSIDKLTKTNFNNREDWDTYPTSDYSCDKCGQVISISFQNLNKHQFSKSTKLSENDAAEMTDLEIAAPELQTNSFLDFYCPTCHRPVRIYYDAWAGGNHMEAGHTIKFVVD